MLVEVAGLRAAAAEEAVVFEGEEMEGAIDVLLDALVRGFFSSIELVEWTDLCPELADVPAVALLAVFRTVEPAAGRAGGLLNPPVVGRVLDVVGLTAEGAGTVPGRRAATKGRLGATFSFLILVGEAFSVSVSTSDALAKGSSEVETSPGVSS